MMAAQNLLHGVKGAGADIAEDDTQRPQGEGAGSASCLMRWVHFSSRRNASSESESAGPEDGARASLADMCEMARMIPSLQTAGASQTPGWLAATGT